MSEKENGLAGWQKAIQELSNYEPTDKYVLAIHRIKELEQELAVANKCINSLRLSLGKTRLRNGDHEANLIELNALLEQSKKDQSRYLWMRESKNKWHVLSGEDLDNSIDAAIKESSK